MRIAVVAGVLASLLVGAAQSGSAQAQADFFRGKTIPSLALTFDQVTLLKATADTQTTTGELAVMSKPERFKVRFLSPVEQVAVYDGTSLTVYFPAAEQAFRQQATAEQLSLMLGMTADAAA